MILAILNFYFREGICCLFIEISYLNEFLGEVNSSFKYRIRGI
ncbi:hypothetical protein VCRA2117O380_10005 [Vibrio crassostreae]|nr:hypothetical protein VCRA2119O382_10005 [Vibrio crassostreae]CAK1842369.1 hypothetical protein VCRA2117O380_10005 [Vibrio crassostreae]CAK1910231.1 hypothetical protein VCRA2117O379_10640 [Vibrio crassostreae]CAK2048378.1 hypothetical protein VCRA2119O381_400028 [Vibrio crassostreae]CAK2431713.1 hypothetical protein VCRA2113O360_10005 [Vibrio crassostreae]